jgi:hypothetical protein
MFIKKKNYKEIEELAASLFTVVIYENKMAEYWIYVVRVLTCVFNMPIIATFVIA